VQLLAVRPAWVRVRAADGTILFEKILDAGERYTVPQNAEPATLRAGNSGAVYFILNGKAYGPAAPGAQVVKKLTLTASSLEGQYKIADLTRNPDLAGAVAVAQAQPQKVPGQPSQ
jgi:cytoskeleton protein RodZ